MAVNHGGIGNRGLGVRVTESGEGSRAHRRSRLSPALRDAPACERAGLTQR